MNKIQFLIIECLTRSHCSLVENEAVIQGLKNPWVTLKTNMQALPDETPTPQAQNAGRHLLFR